MSIRIHTSNKASGRRTSGMILPRFPFNTGYRSVPFPKVIDTSAKPKTSENSSQNCTPKIPQPHSSAVGTKAVRFVQPGNQFPLSGNVCGVYNTAENPTTGHSSQHRGSLSTVTAISKIPSSSSKNQNASLFQTSTEQGLTLPKVNNCDRAFDQAVRMNASINYQGILSLSPDSANKNQDKSEFTIKKVPLDKCSRPVFKSNKEVASAKKHPKLLLDTSQVIFTNNKPVKKSTQKKKVETITREEIVETEGIKEKLENLNKQKHQENISEMPMETEDIKEKVEKNKQEHEENPSKMLPVDPEEVKIIYEKMSYQDQSIVLMKKDIEPNPYDNGKVVETDLKKTEAEIRNEGKVLEKLVDHNKKALEGIIRVQAYNALPPADEYKANKKFYDNIFPKKWERLMRPLQHLVSSKVCKICIKEFGSIEEARAHFYTKSHVQNHLDQIEKESVCENFLPSGWRHELQLESETIEDCPSDANFPW